MVHELLRTKIKDFLVYRGFVEKKVYEGIFTLRVGRRKMKVDFRKRNCKIWKDNVKVQSIPLSMVEKDLPKLFRYINASIDSMYEHQYD